MTRKIIVILACAFFLPAFALAAPATLFAGQHTPVGSVDVSNDNESLFVNFDLDGWYLLETHLSVECELEDIPQTKKGNPVPGRFALIEEHDMVDSYEYVLDLPECEETYVAAHAVVTDGAFVETAWADGSRFVERGNWATYFSYEPVFCVEGTLWQIGDVDAMGDNPMDEFNYPGHGLGGGMPVFANPFVVGSSLTEDFPWNSNVDKDYATDFNVSFNYPYESGDATLVVSWSPGASASEQKEVFYDGVSLGTSAERQGVSTPGWYNGWAIYQDEFFFDLTSGAHDLTFAHLKGDGTAWDYIQLNVSCE